MTTYTSTLSDEIFQNLSERAKSLSIPKNKIIERALSIYLNQIDKAEYINSYKRAADDANILSIAEEGMEEYFNQLEE